jgi:hypothetical protein
VRAGDIVVLTVVLDRSDQARIDVAAPAWVVDHRMVIPAGLPELVGDLEILVGLRVALVVGEQPGEPVVTGGAVGIAGDDVPADPAPGQVIQCAELARQVERMLLQGRAGEGETEVGRGCAKR